MGLFDSLLDSFRKKQPPITPALERVTKALGYPFRVLDPALSPEEVVQLFSRELSRGRREGYTPLLLPDDEALAERLDKLLADGFDRQAEVQKIGDDGPAVLAKRLSTLKDRPAPTPTPAGEEAAGEGGASSPAPDGAEIDVFLSIMDFIEYERKPLALLKLPTLDPWKSVVYVPFGGWGNCPAPVEMGTVCRYWYEKYSAVPAVISYDSVEFLLPRPVPEQEAGATAREHLLFCPERVYQCTDSGTVKELAKSLSTSRLWYFWWEDDSLGTFNIS